LWVETTFDTDGDGKPEDIPYQLIGELMRKMSVQDWITMYEFRLKK
jgi:hypothetical protein